MATTSSIASATHPDCVVQTITFTGDANFSAALEAGFALCESITVHCAGTGTWSLGAVNASNDGEHFTDTLTEILCPKNAIASFPDNCLGFRNYTLVFLVLAASAGTITVTGRKRVRE